MEQPPPPQPPQPHYKGQLSNGLRYICQHTSDEDQTVAIFIVVRYGSATDPPAQAGMAHLIEHMLFKGTPQLMGAFEAIGARANAFTDRTVTAYHAKCAHGHLETVLNQLCEMVLHCNFNNNNNNNNMQRELRREKQVVANELRDHLDNSSRRLLSAVYKSVFVKEMARNQTKDSLAALPALTLAQLVAAYQKYYVAENVIVSLCGNLKSHNHNVVALLHKCLSSVPQQQQQQQTLMRAETHLAAPPPAPATALLVVPSLVPNPKQRTIMLVFPTNGYKWRHTQYFYTEMFGLIFANLTSSRLFQTLREKKGLVYSVKASQAAHDYVGYFAIKTTTAPRHVAQVVRILKENVARVRTEGINAAEFVLARDNFLATWAMAQENPMTQAMYNASEFFYNKDNFVSYEQVLTRLLTVLTRKEMNRYLHKLLNPAAARLFVC